jgi:four helix bundle protein
VLHNFRSYQLAVQFYQQAQGVKLPYHLKEQLNRAASSIALNLSEGSGKESKKDRRRFYRIAFGSVRECQAIFELAQIRTLLPLLDNLAGHVFKLCKALE